MFMTSTPSRHEMKMLTIDLGRFNFVACSYHSANGRNQFRTVRTVGTVVPFLLASSACMGSTRSGPGTTCTTDAKGMKFLTEDAVRWKLDEARVSVQSSRWVRWLKSQSTRCGVSPVHRVNAFQKRRIRPCGAIRPKSNGHPRTIGIDSAVPT